MSELRGHPFSSSSQVDTTGDHPRSGLVNIDGTQFYVVPEIDRLEPFLMSIVSDGDRWMFVSSTGALTAGRVDSSGALFPYETDDRLHKAAGQIGPVTSVWLMRDSEEVVWRPFAGKPGSNLHRSLYKSVVGESVIFEEVNEELGLRFRYRWTSSDEFGFIRSASLRNDGEEEATGALLDGLVNILPHGLDPSLYQRMSNLTNAYKRSEIIDASGHLAVFSLESGIVDRAEPAEVLKGTVVWSVGLDDATVSVSPRTIDDFEAGGTDDGVSLLTGRPGSYLLSSEFSLDPGTEKSWQIVAEVAQDQAAVAGLRALLQSDTDLAQALESSAGRAKETLIRIMALADSQQCTGDRIATAHHFSNVTYNVMRGGVPLFGYAVQPEAFADFVLSRNGPVADRHYQWLRSLPDDLKRGQLLEEVESVADPNLTRLALEYLPFSFSRRHGDPSRPWNAFSIRVRDVEGEPVIHYEGNWRDIYQNWEALCHSFPIYLPGVIAVFVNASTRDGFNPYRITSEGIDWEVPVPDDPWSNIGYWGDHQIVYLSRLLATADRFLPGRIEQMLPMRWFTYADVPYRLRPYEEIVADPKSTIEYDEEAASMTAKRVEAVGADGKLVWDDEGQLVLVTLLEKLIVPALSKLSNFVPGGGIWMNTQRPEWNDANNALVGFGLSMVTLNHLRQYLNQLESLVSDSALKEVELSTVVATWMSDVMAALHNAPATARLTDRSRKETMDRLGEAFSEYRRRLGSSENVLRTTVSCDSIIELCGIAIEKLDDTIRQSVRPDGLYHSYNLIRFSDDGSEAAVLHLHEMLEGQVAILDSGVLTADERADVIDALFDSEMYRADQRSFMLYPARRPPSFLEKNVIPDSAVGSNRLLQRLIETGDDSLVATDVEGKVRFNASFGNRADMVAAMDQLAADETWHDLVEANREATLETYEEVFQHHSYTGRSGSMYGYEGIGSVYWHMVAKLLLAVQDSAHWADETGASSAAVDRLVAAYWRVRSGLGFNKSAYEFGAIPLDPYSHTPALSGAQQPGMTGLVKEELLTRWMEVGVSVRAGCIQFGDLLLRPDELLEQPVTWRLRGGDSVPREVQLDEETLGFTICQVPVIVASSEEDPHLEVLFANGRLEQYSGLTLPRSLSSKVFARNGEIATIRAHMSQL